VRGARRALAFQAKNPLVLPSGRCACFAGLPFFYFIIIFLVLLVLDALSAVHVSLLALLLLCFFTARRREMPCVLARLIGPPDTPECCLLSFVAGVFFRESLLCGFAVSAFVRLILWVARRQHIPILSAEGLFSRTVLHFDQHSYSTVIEEGIRKSEG